MKFKVSGWFIDAQHEFRVLNEDIMTKLELYAVLASLFHKVSYEEIEESEKV